MSFSPSPFRCVMGARCALSVREGRRSCLRGTEDASSYLCKIRNFVRHCVWRAVDLFSGRDTVHGIKITLHPLVQEEGYNFFGLRILSARSHLLRDAAASSAIDGACTGRAVGVIASLRWSPAGLAAQAVLKAGSVEVRFWTFHFAKSGALQGSSAACLMWSPAGRPPRKHRDLRAAFRMRSLTIASAPLVLGSAVNSEARLKALHRQCGFEDDLSSD